MIKYIQCEDGWYKLPLSMIIGVGIVLGIVVSALIVIILVGVQIVVGSTMCIFGGGFFGLPNVLFTILVFVIMSLLSSLYLVRRSRYEKLKKFIVKDKDDFTVMTAEIQNLLDKSEMKYRIVSSGKASIYFYLYGLEANLNIFYNESLGHMSISVLPETPENRIEFDNLKTQIVSLLKERDFEEYFPPNVIIKR